MLSNRLPVSSLPVKDEDSPRRDSAVDLTHERHDYDGQTTNNLYSFFKPTDNQVGIPILTRKRRCGRVRIATKPRTEKANSFQDNPSNARYTWTIITFLIFYILILSLSVFISCSKSFLQPVKPTPHDCHVHVTASAGEPESGSGKPLARYYLFFLLFYPESFFEFIYFFYIFFPMAAVIKAANAKIRSNKVLDYVCSTRMCALSCLEYTRQKNTKKTTTEMQAGKDQQNRRKYTIQTNLGRAGWLAAIKGRELDQFRC